MATKGLMKLMLKIQLGKLSEFIEEKIKDADGSVYMALCVIEENKKWLYKMDTVGHGPG